MASALCGTAPGCPGSTTAVGHVNVLVVHVFRLLWPPKSPFTALGLSSSCSTFALRLGRVFGSDSAEKGELSEGRDVVFFSYPQPFSFLSVWVRWSLFFSSAPLLWLWTRTAVFTKLSVHVLALSVAAFC